MSSGRISPQIPLHMSFREDAVFEDYLPGQNAVAVGMLRQSLANLSEHLVFLWGAKGCGVSHLLQASVNDLQLQGLDAAYLPLSECYDFGPEALEGLDVLDAVAIDDIDMIADNPEWAEGLFHFYNRMRDSGRLILVGGQCSPLQMTLTLADLKSRLSSGLTLQLVAMSDEERTDWVVWKGRKRGLVIERDVAEFLILRHNQNMHEMVNTFDLLDEASLAEQRRLTIPFVKQVLGW
ncbi:DnaA regulatory inactivator Hda [Reinekea marinisedimentorum]|uniref:Regulatory inactivation of DnaA Hda protein n=1 Tax=Reinekea marinisedimentorum TaxID=230495 RepID=A0A4R3I9T7_9GAMM|nr:DnaA regulatory inactivator Hda [Reinekea marinisedimentorum]TCS42648.1 regulatory inactivation of DnaA Hda protein [Reinekea marinisedimentorum]